MNNKLTTSALISLILTVLDIGLAYIFQQGQTDIRIFTILAFTLVIIAGFLIILCTLRVNQLERR